MSKITFYKNIPLYNSYENPIYFENDAKRSQFFDYYEYDQDYSSYTKEINFKPSNLLNTTIDLAIYDAYGDVRGLDAYNYNYAIYDDDSTQSLYYYFITNINYKSNNVYSFDMELDVMTTYIPNSTYEFKGKLPVERKMCNRFVPYEENGTTRYKLDFKYAKVLEGNNNPQVAKLYKPGYKLSTTLNNPIADDKFKNATWTYFFYTMKKTTEQDTEDSWNTLKYTNDNGDIIDSGLYCVCLPNFRWAFKEDDVYRAGDDVNSFYRIFKDGTGTRNIVNIVNSPYPPWNDLRTDLKYVDAIVSPGYIEPIITKKAIYFPPTDDITYASIQDGNDPNIWGVIFIKKFTSHKILFDYIIDNPKYQTIYPSEFRQEGIPKILKYEPKLYNSDNSYLKIIDREGNSYKYDYTLLDSNGYKLQLKSKNCINVEGTSTFYYIDANEGNYDEKVERTSYDYPVETFSGLSSMTIDGQNVFSDAFTDYIQQHKNFLLSGLLSNTKLDVGVRRGVKYKKMDAYGLNDLLGYDIYKKEGKGFTPTAQAGVDISGLMQTALQIDDIANTPLEVTSTKGNFVNKFMMHYRLLPYIVSYELTEIQKKNIYDIYFKFGYLVNSDFTFNECMQRLGFNYIKTGESIKQLIEPVEDVPIPNNVIDKIDSIFRKGTRLWKLNSQNKVYNNFNFDYENWEDIQ